MGKCNVVVLTSNFSGGVLQFANQMQQELQKIYGKTVLFVPHNVEKTGPDTEIYTRKNSVLPWTSIYKKIAEAILRYSPKLVVICESDLITSRIALHLAKKVNVAMVVHDAVDHPYYNQKLLWFKNQLKRPYILRSWKKCDKIILLSENTKKDYLKQYPEYKDKLQVIKLGAHVPEVVAEKPTELCEEKDYFLFFGRMDKYKGMIRLLNAYHKQKEHLQTKLILAGNGTISEEEQAIIESDKEKIILIKRYIKDEEMVWLFEHAKAVVLPYIEASQSGVLAMAYWFKKPVVVSDLEGLTEFVRHGETGYIFRTQEELEAVLCSMDQSEEEFSLNVSKYYMEHMDWNGNLKKCFDELF